VSTADRTAGDRRGPSTLVEKITAAAPTLTPKMRRVADFIHEEYRRAAFMTTREIAQQAGVSLATVIRLPGALGYADFDALRASMEDRLNFELSAVERLHTMSEETPSGAGLLQRAIRSETDELHHLAATFDEARFHEFVTTIAAAASTTIVGVRWVSPLAEYLRYSLNKLKPGVRGYTRDDSMLYDDLTLLGPDDVLIVISFARYPRSLIAALSYARDRQVPIIGITDSPLSPVGEFCSTTLYVRSQLLDFMGTLGAPGALINCVVSAVGIELGEQAYDRLAQFEDTATATDMYVQAPTGREHVPHERGQQ